MSVNNKKLIDIEKLSRYHENLKGVLNTKEAAGAAAAAEAAAKAYADEEIAKLSFDEAGAAAEALDAAKEYVDGLVADVNATIVDNERVATEALTNLDIRVGNLEAIDHDKLAADATAAAKSYTDEEIEKLSFDEAGTAKALADAALAAAKEDAAGKYQVKGNYETAGAAAQALVDAKVYADGLVKNEDGSVKFDDKGAAATAEQNAKTYADGLVKNEDGSVKFDDKGAAAAAEAAAKKYADDLATNYDAAGTADGLNAAMDERVKVLEAIDHEQLAADASAAAVAAIVAGAESDFDTLKEVADWINNDKTGAAALQVAVSEHGEAIEDLKNNKQNTIEDLETIRTGAAAGAVAEQNAKAYADGLATNYDAAGAAATAEAAAKAYADGLATNYDAAGSAAAAQSAAEATAKAYTDAEIVKVNANIEEAERVTAESLTDLDARVKDLKDTTYNKTEIDTMVGNVIVVASNEDIDNLFN